MHKVSHRTYIFFICIDKEEIYDTVVKVDMLYELVSMRKVKYNTVEELMSAYNKCCILYDYDLNLVEKSINCKISDIEEDYRNVTNMMLRQRFNTRIKGPYTFRVENEFDINHSDLETILCEKYNNRTLETFLNECSN